MTTSVLDRVDLDAITVQARQVKFGHTVLAFVAFLLIWTGRVAGYAWLIPVWCAVAVRTGWRDVHPKMVSDGRAGTR
jgi:hypothetical protein